MDFKDKLAALLVLTAAKNAELAAYLGVGRPYISRLKSGERKLPADPRLVRGMAAFFAGRCEDDYRRGALGSLTGDPRVHAYVGEAALADILCDWLTGALQREASPAARFLSSFSGFAPDAHSRALSIQSPARRFSAPDGLAVYQGNEGKRQALRDMLAYMETLEERPRIRVFTDEESDWLDEDAAFFRDLNRSLSSQAAAGFVFERIQPPSRNVESAFDAISRWLPGYIAGVVRQYHYPWPRDRLHRRTLFVVPNHIALFSDSVCGEGQSRLTFLTGDAVLVDNCDKEFDALLQRCRPALRTYSMDEPERLFRKAEATAAIDADGVYKTSSLSINTLPEVAIERIRQRGSSLARRLCLSFARRSQARIRLLASRSITDIMCLPALENVRAGREPIPGTQALPQGCLYYTPAEYKAHLERILWHLDAFPNYQAVFADDLLARNVVVYTKGDDLALLIKETAPFSMFSIEEHSLASAFCDYLRRIAEEQMGAGARRATAERLRQELRRLP